MDTNAPPFFKPLSESKPNARLTDLPKLGFRLWIDLCLWPGRDVGESQFR